MSNQQQTYLDMVTAREPYRAVTDSDRVNARSELADLRSRIKELVMKVQYANQSIGVCQNCGHFSSDHNSDGIHPCGQCDCLAYATTQPATLTPRQCNRACFERGWQAAIEAAAFCVDEYAVDMLAIGDDELDVVIDRDGMISKSISALQPPAECGDCNPLKPSEHDAAIPDEWHKRM